MTPSRLPAGAPTSPAQPPLLEQTEPSARERLNLIEQITEAAVVSDYADQTASWPDEGHRRQRVLVAAAALALAGFVLALGVSARVINAPVVNTQRAALIERIAAVDARQETLGDEVEALRLEVAELREINLRVTSEGRLLAESIADLELATGYVMVEGPGAVVTLSHAPFDEASEEPDLERVLDSDIQLTVNGLWAAGAEAIAINGQRLTAQSAIRSAASAILVNYRPLKPPYRVEAIGPADLADRFGQTPDAAELRGVSEQFGIGLEATPVDQVRLRPATAPLPAEGTVVGPEEGEAQ